MAMKETKKKEFHLAMDAPGMKEIDIKSQLEGGEWSRKVIHLSSEQKFQRGDAMKGSKGHIWGCFSSIQLGLSKNIVK
eukprot:9919586-Ditylum_brightwellii.AAC.1